MKFDGHAFVRDWMGKRVTFKQFFFRRQIGDKRWWEVTDFYEVQVGWVVGATYLQTGKRYAGQGGYDYFGLYDYDPPGFEETGKRVLAYLVTRWPTHKPYRVPPGAVELLTEDIKPSAVSDAGRRFQSKHSHRLPRDEKGRFVSGPLLPIGLGKT